MTKEQLAAHLQGWEYPIDLTSQERNDAKDSGLVVIYGASDDLVEIDGAIQDEGGSCGTFEFRLDENGLVPEPDEDERETLEKFGVMDAVAAKGKKFKAIWDRNGISWQYETDIPHATFEIMEDGEVYCRGIVFKAKELTISTAGTRDS